MGQFARLVLAIVALAALGNGAVAWAELGRVHVSSSGTVFQQISARLDLGLSVLAFAVAVGLMGILSELGKQAPQRAALLDALRPKGSAEPTAKAGDGRVDLAAVPTIRSP